MKNNNGKGLYEIGEKHHPGCGCIVVAKEVGYIHYINPDCTLDNKYHPQYGNYEYRSMPLGGSNER